MVFHVAKLDGIDLCFFPVMIWLITLLCRKYMYYDMDLKFNNN